GKGRQLTGHGPSSERELRPVRPEGADAMRRSGKKRTSGRARGLTRRGSTHSMRTGTRRQRGAPIRVLDSLRKLDEGELAALRPVHDPRDRVLPPLEL